MAKSLKESPNSDLYLSSEVIFMILASFPVKSLLQMKLVCSVWHSMISTPRFIKEHLDRANDVHSLRLKRYIIGRIKESIGLIDQDPRFEQTIPVTEFSSDVEVLGSCNGLLLLGDGDCTYYLWNPSTRLFRNFKGPYIFKGEFRNFALGYDSTTSAYKVVRIVRVTSHKDGLKPRSYNYRGYDAISAHVYNCKTYCWKKITNFPYVIFENAQGVTMNGSPHWVMFRDRFVEDDEVIDFVIVYFDLVEEKFKEIPKPSWLVDSSTFEFGVFEGKLCFIRYTKFQNEVWIMQKYGEESWVNLSSVIDITSVRVPGWSSVYKVDHPSRSTAFFGASYVESLVSPFGGGDMIG